MTTTVLDYHTHLAAKAEEWRTRYPERAAELRSLVRRQLGLGLGAETRSPFALKSLQEAEQHTLRVVYGWPGEQAWRGASQGAET